MLNLQFVTDFILQNFTQVTVTDNGTHFHARCLLCGDSKKSQIKKRFHLDWKNGKPVYKCWNCGKSGSFFKLYMIVKKCSEEDARRKLYKYDPKRLLQSLKKPATIPTETASKNIHFNNSLDDFTNENDPVESVLLKSWLNILSAFREKRKIPKTIKLFYAWKGKYQGRIIIPIFDKYMNLIYFQARRQPGTGIDPKYKNPSSKKELVVLNEHNFRDDHYIIITEGLLDAFMVGNQGTTCLGKEISPTLIRRLEKQTNFKPGLILAYDNDEDGQKSLKKFMASDMKQMVKYFLMPTEYNDCKDINNIRVNHDVKDMYNFVVQNSYDYFTAVMKLGGCERR